MIARVKSILILALAASFFASCNVPVGEAFRPYRNISAEPDRPKIVGTWVPDEATLEDLRGRGGYDVSVPIQLILRDDGDLEMVNMPDWWVNESGKSYKGLSSTSGRWRLAGGPNHWAVGLSCFGKYIPVNLVEHKFRSKPRYYIQFFLGDPDSGEEMIFVRKE
jgi:hypothetical protein